MLVEWLIVAHGQVLIQFGIKQALPLDERHTNTEPGAVATGSKPR